LVVRQGPSSERNAAPQLEGDPTVGSRHSTVHSWQTKDRQACPVLGDF
jgi:hypothetical protein